jgi:two-component system sensor histidine kinase NreB
MVRFDYFSAAKPPAWLEVSCDRLPDGLLISLRDVTRRRLLENNLGVVVASLLKQHDDGRRELSRELHDQVAQDLVLALMELEGLRERTKADRRTTSLREIWTVLRRALVGVRAMSTRIYPPMLDESGIETSLRWLIREFKARSGAKVRLAVSRTTLRRSHSVELAIFSVVEEAFKLIEQSGSDKQVEVDLAIAGHMATIRVRAIGKVFAAVLNAFDELAVADTGILQLWTRIRHLGGTIEAKTAARSATLSVSLPFPEFSGREPRFSGTEIFRRALRRQRALRLRLAIPDGASARRQGRVSRP